MNYERERRQFACLIMHTLTRMFIVSNCKYNELEVADECDKAAQEIEFKLKGDLIDTDWAYEAAEECADKIFDKCAK